MSDRFKSILAVYLSILACALAVVSMKEDDYRSRASRLDLKVMTLEIKEQSKVIDRMGVLRNQTRAKAEMMEKAVLLVAIALAVASPAFIAGAALGAWFLVSVSVLSVGGAGWFSWMAVT